jgi:hypothetical protein
VAWIVAVTSCSPVSWPQCRCCGHVARWRRSLLGAECGHEIRAARVTPLARSGQDLGPIAARDRDCCRTNPATPTPSHRAARSAQLTETEANSQQCRKTPLHRYGVGAGDRPSASFEADAITNGSS